MDKALTNHYFIFYEGDRCKHIIARPKDVEIFNCYDDSQPESKIYYSNIYRCLLMAVRIHTEEGSYIEFPDVTEVWSFSGDSDLSADFQSDRHRNFHLKARGGYRI